MFWKKTDDQEELLRSKKYFELSYYYMFCEFLPKGHNSIPWRILHTVELFVYPLLLLNCGIWMVNELYVLEITGDQTKFSYLMTYLGGTYQGLWKYLILLKYRKELRNIGIFISELRDSLKTSNLSSEIRRRKLPKALKLYTSFIWIYFRTTILAVLFVCCQNSYTTTFTAPLLHTIPSTHWFLNFLLQCLEFVVICIVVLGSDIVLVMSVGYLVGELKTITGLASKINDENDILENVFLLHVRIHQMLDELRRIFWQLSLHIILSNFVMLCLYLYTTRYVSITIPSIFALLTIIFQLVIICSIGQVLLDSTEGVADALWQTSWYELKVEDQKAFLFILRMAQIPKGITACDLTIISVNTLVQVLKTSLSFAAFIYTTIN